MSVAACRYGLRLPSVCCYTRMAITFANNPFNRRWGCGLGGPSPLTARQALEGDRRRRASCNLPHGIERTSWHATKRAPVVQPTCSCHMASNAQRTPIPHRAYTRRATRQALKETAHKTGEKASKNLIRRTIKARCLHLRHDMQRSPGAQHTPAIRCCGARYRRRAARGRPRQIEGRRSTAAGNRRSPSRPVHRLQ